MIRTKRFFHRLAVVVSMALTLALGVSSVVHTHVAYAQDIPSPQESILNFDSTVSVNTDNSVDVKERIDYSTGEEPRHGIYRDIDPTTSDGRKVAVSVSSVTDGSGNEYRYTVSKVGDFVRVKIGDPNTTFVGPKTYVIEYKMEKAVAQLKDTDEIYWNVTGNSWNMPIRYAQVSVRLPSLAKTTQSACYYGPQGSTSKCDAPVEQSDGSYLFKYPYKLSASEGLTVALGFPKGVVLEYSKADLAVGFFQKYKPWFIALIPPLLVFIFTFTNWYRNGRDPKGTGVIIPEYDVPEGLTPIEVAVIMSEKFVTKHISAEIIYLATRGYIKIIEIDKKTIFSLGSKDYELRKLKESIDLPNEFDKVLMEGIFKSEPSVILSDLKNSFYRKVKTITNNVLDGLVSKEIYRTLGNMKSPGKAISAVLFIFWVVLFLGPGMSTIFSAMALPFVSAIILSFVVYAIVSHFYPAKTEKGVALHEKLLGLKEYLQIAEKDRINFHNAPEKKPEVFDRLLPFAMVMGVERAWAKEFEGIYTTPPEWYGSTSGMPFNVFILNDSLGNFRTDAMSSMMTSPERSNSGFGGSGGGGSSGGGGGGGGGGSW